jgi:hypothetical protein
MHPKLYFTAILFLSATFLFSFSGKAQNSADTIRIEKKGLGYVYYHDNVTIYLKQIRALTASNPKVRALLGEYDYMRSASYLFAAAGGGCIGWALGDALSSAMFGTTINKPVFFSLLAGGAAFVGIAFAFDAGANNKVKAAVKLFNKSQKDNNNTNLNLGFSPNGINLKLNF